MNNIHTIISITKIIHLCFSVQKCKESELWLFLHNFKYSHSFKHLNKRLTCKLLLLYVYAFIECNGELQFVLCSHFNPVSMELAVWYAKQPEHFHGQ